jgi:hypothetical protein
MHDYSEGSTALLQRRLCRAPFVSLFFTTSAKALPRSFFLSRASRMDTKQKTQRVYIYTRVSFYAHSRFHIYLGPAQGIYRNPSGKHHTHRGYIYIPVFSFMYTAQTIYTSSPLRVYIEIRLVHTTRTEGIYIYTRLFSYFPLFF